MRVLLRLLVLSLMVWVALLGAQARDGDFQIRFEPTAKLQTGPPVPFSITVRDSLSKPVAHATVSLQIEDSNGGSVQVFRATEISAGNYVAKPAFKTGGDWSIYVEVRRDQAISARTIQFQVTN